MKRGSKFVLVLLLLFIAWKYIPAIHFPKPCSHHWKAPSGVLGEEYYVNDCTGKTEGTVYQESNGNWFAAATHALVVYREFGSYEHDRAKRWIELKENTYW